MIVHRILLTVLLVLGIAGCVLTRFVDMALLNLPSVYAELDSVDTTAPRRAQLVTGLNNLWEHQFAANTYLWWIGVATLFIAGIALALTFRSPRR